MSEIAAVLLKDGKNTAADLGLLEGQPGTALFFFYYARLTGDDTYSEYAFDTMSSVFDEINNGFGYASFSSGLAGVGWTLEHLVRHGFFEAATDDLLTELDPMLYEKMISDIREKNYDYLHGALGGGLYFLERLPNADARLHLEALIAELETVGLPVGGGGVQWLSTRDFETGKRACNTSLAHGTASIIAFLSKVHNAGICTEKTAALLTGTVHHLLNQRLSGGDHLSCFPAWVEDGEEPVSSRLAWCYGDLGIGIALWQAARALENSQWERTAVEVMRHSTGRRALKENTVLDAGLCHGTAGIAHIYNRMYHYTGEDIFKDSAAFWLRETLKMARFGQGNAGFRTKYADEFGGWVIKGGLLEGIAGIGLAFMSTISDIEPAWDRCLLLS